MFFCSGKFLGSRIIFLLRLFFINTMIFDYGTLHSCFFIWFGLYSYPYSELTMLCYMTLCQICHPMCLILDCDTALGYKEGPLLMRRSSTFGETRRPRRIKRSSYDVQLRKPHMHAAVSGIIWLHMSFDWMPILSCSCMSHYNAQH